MSDALAVLKGLENRLFEIPGEYEALLEELGEEEKEQDFVNEGKDAFVAAEVKKALKSRVAEPQTLAILKKADALNDEEKVLKKKIKEESTALHLTTKATIESLSDDAMLELLRKKWILPLVGSLRSLPDAVVTDLIGKLEVVCKKYETTFAEVEEEIAETERSLVSLLDDLTGSEFDMVGLAEFKKLLGGGE